MTVELDFELEPYYEPPNDVDFLMVIMEISAFKGTNVFKIDDTNFSNYIPVLWFAWQMRRLYRWIEIGKKPYSFYSIPNQYGLTFVRRGEEVEVFDHRRPSQHATVSIKDLRKAVRSYYRRAYKACVKKRPLLKEHAAFQDWFFQNYDESEP